MATSLENSITKLNKLLRIELIVFAVIGALAGLGFAFFDSPMFKGVCLSIFPLMLYGIFKEYTFHHGLQEELERESAPTILNNIKTDYIREVKYFDTMTIFFVIGMVLALWGAGADMPFICGTGIGIVLFAGLLMVAHVITNYILEILHHEISRENRP